MIDLKPLKSYIEPIDSFLKDIVLESVQRNGIYKFLDKMFYSIDCTRLDDNGIKLNQTVGYIYSCDITKIFYAIQEFVQPENKDYYYQKLLSIHNANLEFEKINPPVIYDTTKKQTTKRTKKVKQQELDILGAPKKQTAAEKKLVAKALKLSSLSISFTPKSKV